jgi:hypothetical protein
MRGLKAGRELDLLVAESVMGQFACAEWTPLNFGSAGGPAFRKDCAHEDCYPASERGSALGRVGGCPGYSTRLNVAWRVVERLRARGFSFALASAGEAEYQVEFTGPGRGAAARARAGEPALAICLAALDAAKSLGPRD